MPIPRHVFRFRCDNTLGYILPACTHTHTHTTLQPCGESALSNVPLVLKEQTGTSKASRSSPSQWQLSTGLAQAVGRAVTHLLVLSLAAEANTRTPERDSMAAAIVTGGWDLQRHRETKDRGREAA